MTEPTIISKSPEETYRLGLSLAQKFSPGDGIFLEGELGAGKSVLARGIAEGLGVTDWQGSPTFILVHEYPTEPVVNHIDLYRLSENEVRQSGLDEYLREDSVVIVEWPDRAPGYLLAGLSAKPLWISLEITSPRERRLTFQRLALAGEQAPLGTSL